MTVKKAGNPTAAAGLDKLKLLVVSTNAAQRQVLSRMAQDLGFRTINQATTGAGALAQMGLFGPEIVLYATTVAPLDILEYTRLIRRSKDSTYQFAVILAIGEITPRLKADCLDAGIHDFVVTPTLPTLALAIQTAITNARGFVRTEAYFGPDRRLAAKAKRKGPERRVEVRDLIAPPYLEAFRRAAEALPPIGTWMVEEAAAPPDGEAGGTGRTIGPKTRLGLASLAPAAPSAAMIGGRKTAAPPPEAPPATPPRPLADNAPAPSAPPPLPPEPAVVRPTPDPKGVPAKPGAPKRSPLTLRPATPPVRPPLKSPVPESMPVQVQAPAPVQIQPAATTLSPPPKPSSASPTSSPAASSPAASIPASNEGTPNEGTPNEGIPAMSQDALLAALGGGSERGGKRRPSASRPSEGAPQEAPVTAMSQQDLLAALGRKQAEPSPPSAPSRTPSPRRASTAKRPAEMSPDDLATALRAWKDRPR
ncbi:MAG: hypothetical protein H7840_16020 [Alphaproteobacteria bacterium]